MTNKDKYIAFCETRGDIPIFSQPWWLDAVCTDGSWNVCIVEKNNHVQGTLPYYLSKLKGFSIIRLPMLTAYLGVQVFYPNGLTTHKQSSFEQKVTTELIEQLPKASYIQQIQYPNFTNWLPFHWDGFKQTTMYSYQLNIKNIDAVFNAFRQNLKRNLKKAEKDLRCTQSDDLALFYELNKTTFIRQKMNIPYSYDFLQRLDSELKKRNQRKIFITYDTNNKAVSAGYYVWDNQTAYYLAGGHTGNREAMSWTMWHAIQYFSDKVQLFDFEGSIIKNIAHFFSGFGATPVPYHHIFKGNKLIDILKVLKS